MLLNRYSPLVKLGITIGMIQASPTFSSHAYLELIDRSKDDSTVFDPKTYWDTEIKNSTNLLEHFNKISTDVDSYESKKRLSIFFNENFYTNFDKPMILSFANAFIESNLSINKEEKILSESSLFLFFVKVNYSSLTQNDMLQIILETIKNERFHRMVELCYCSRVFNRQFTAEDIKSVINACLLQPNLNAAEFTMSLELLNFSDIIDMKAILDVIKLCKKYTNISKSERKSGIRYFLKAMGIPDIDSIEVIQEKVLEMVAARVAENRPLCFGADSVFLLRYLSLVKNLPFNFNFSDELFEIIYFVDLNNMFGILNVFIVMDHKAPGLRLAYWMNKALERRNDELIFNIIEFFMARKYVKIKDLYPVLNDIDSTACSKIEGCLPQYKSDYKKTDLSKKYTERFIWLLNRRINLEKLSIYEIQKLLDIINDTLKVK